MSATIPVPDLAATAELEVKSAERRKFGARPSGLTTKRII